MLRTFLIGDRCGLQMQASQTHSVCMKHESQAERGLSCLNNLLPLRKRRHLDGSVSKTFYLITASMLFLIFVEANVSFSQKQLKRGLIRPQNTCPLSFCPSEMSSCPQKLVDKWLPPCVIQFQVHTEEDCVELKMVFQATPEPMWLY